MRRFKHLIPFLVVIFYLNDSLPGRPGERRIIKVVQDNQQFSVRRGNFNPNHSTLAIDESDLRNQDTVLDVANNLRETDFRNLEKYYVDSSTRVWRRGGWRPRRFGPYTPTANVQISFVRSQERTDVEDNLQQMLAALATIASSSTDQEKRTLATALRRYIRFDLRRENPN